MADSLVLHFSRENARKILVVTGRTWKFYTNRGSTKQPNRTCQTQVFCRRELNVVSEG